MKRPTLLRRHTVSAPSSPVASNNSRGSKAHYHSPQPAARSRAHYHTSQPPAIRYRNKKLVYESPRLDTPDALLFPASHSALLRNHEARWRYMSALAGHHRQDATVFRVNTQRVATPVALQAGMMKQSALRVTSLHLPVLSDEFEPEKDVVAELAAWLDAIVMTFPNLQHLFLQQNGGAASLRGSSVVDVPDTVSSPCETDKYAVADTIATPASTTLINTDETAVRRLYIIYRIPRLETLDGTTVTEQERRLARPSKRRSGLQEQQSAACQPDGERDGNLKDNSSANISKKVDGIVCLLDDLEDDEEEEDMENDDPAEFPSPRKSRRTVSDAAVEIDVNGLPIFAPERPAAPRHRRSRTSEDHVVRSPPRLLDGDRWEFASVESSAAACEWAAACGGLSLPYFRKTTMTAAAANREQTKSKFHLKLKRLDKSSNHASRKVPAKKLTEYTSDDFIPSRIRSHADEYAQSKSSTLHDSSVPPTDSVGKQQMAGADMAEPRKSDSPTSTSTHGSLSSANQDRLPRVPAAHSLTSPFPMQFRIRAAVSPQAVPSREDGEKQDLKIATNFLAGDGSPGQGPPPPRPIHVAMMETIEVSRTRSSPTKFPSFRSRLNPPPILTKSDLPPPCPGARRKTIPAGGAAACTIPRSNTTAKALTKRSKRRGTLWRDKLSARSFSVMDGDDDDDDDVDDDSFLSCSDEDFAV